MDIPGWCGRGRSPEFYALRYEQASSYLVGGSGKDREIALYILGEQLGVSDDEVNRLIAEAERASV